ncbi:MAG: flippase-like domain-containing protein [Chloroflexi bacterium]|nr:flippase-like domain-containing protein [Chloroflexota bacterium]MCL5075290.1 flippase-like domain-containing protein [Chloroflexota bacterium]
MLTSLRRNLLVLQLLAGGLLLVLILSRLDMAKLGRIFQSADYRYILLGIALFVVSTLIDTYRWQIFVKPLGVAVSLRRLFAYYYISLLLGMFLPGKLGQDLTRIVALSRSSKHNVESTASVLMVRFMGIVALSLIASLSLVLSWPLVRHTNITIGVIVLCLICGTGLIVLFNKQLSARIFHLTFGVSVWDMKDIAERSYTSLSLYREPRVLLKGLGLSIATHLVAISYTYTLSLAVGLNTSFLIFLSVIPLITVASMIPVTFQGIGVREGAFVYIFSQLGIMAEKAFALSLTTYLLSILSALIGIVAYFSLVMRAETQPIADLPASETRITSR